MQNFLFEDCPFMVKGKGFIIQVIDKKKADSYICLNHYSKTSVWNSPHNFGVFIKSKLCGVIQFGLPMNPKSGKNICLSEPYLELSRMAYDLPENVWGTQVISSAIKLLKKRSPGIQWVQSFADERCGKMGGIYQASSFLYLGSHQTTFYELDGRFYHKSMYGRKAVDKRGWKCGPTISHFVKNQERAKPHVFSQYRYFKPLTKKALKKLVMSPMEYPKTH